MTAKIATTVLAAKLKALVNQSITSDDRASRTVDRLPLQSNFT